ncbi:hypothetical protein QBC38DRAFT_153401 [Podospora fimiseda]|uniref:Uncharacterized protein n=1 Tax=Podospora fimiseda TaxID=252190 RepID=A0AAN7GWH0_9PEZI|nr:hypothetical protein QBC38DRAFT_153401 [Podospora fimiseda]
MFTTKKRRRGCGLRPLAFFFFPSVSFLCPASCGGLIRRSRGCAFLASFLPTSVEREQQFLFLQRRRLVWGGAKWCVVAQTQPQQLHAREKISKLACICPCPQENLSLLSLC